jgi:Leucine Rich repeat
MRFVSALLLFVCLFVCAGPAFADVAKLEKAGAKVTREGMTLQVHFARLDDKTALLLKGLSNVSKLVVEDGSRLTDRAMAAIGSLHGLQELQLFRPAITNGGLAPLKELKELKVLVIADARISDSGLNALKDHETLEDLDLSGTNLTNAAGDLLKTIAKLKSLNVSKTKFGDAGAADLKDLKDLKVLHATNANVTAKGAMELEAAIKGVRVRR